MELVAGGDVATLGVSLVRRDSERVLVATPLGTVLGWRESVTLSAAEGEALHSPWRRALRGSRRSWEQASVVAVACGGSASFREVKTGLRQGVITHSLRSERPTLRGQRRFGHAQMPSLGGDILGVAPPVVRFHALLAHELAVDELVGVSRELRERRVAFAEELVGMARRDDEEAGRSLQERRARTSQAVLCSALNLWRLTDEEMRACPDALRLALELVSSWEGTAAELRESALAAVGVCGG